MDDKILAITEQFAVPVIFVCIFSFTSSVHDKVEYPDPDDAQWNRTYPEDKKSMAGDQAAKRFTKPTTTIKKIARTTPYRISFKEDCDYLVHYCMRAYTTGKLCARTLYYTYHTFKNYCLMDYVNCMERYEIWQVVHMGECFEVQNLTEYLLYPYDDDYFLDQYYVFEDH